MEFSYYPYQVAGVPARPRSSTNDGKMAEPAQPVREPGFMLPLVMSTLAGLATSLGAAVVFCLGTLPTPKQMAFTLGIAIGVMVTVSVFDLYLPTAWEFGKPSVVFFCRRK